MSSLCLTCGAGAHSDLVIFGYQCTMCSERQCDMHFPDCPNWFVCYSCAPAAAAACNDCADSECSGIGSLCGAGESRPPPSFKFPSALHYQCHSQCESECSGNHTDCVSTVVAGQKKYSLTRIGKRNARVYKILRNAQKRAHARGRAPQCWDHCPETCKGAHTDCEIDPSDGGAYHQTAVGRRRRRRFEKERARAYEIHKINMARKIADYLAAEEARHNEWRASPEGLKFAADHAAWLNSRKIEG